MVAVSAHHVEIARDSRLLPLLAVRERRLAVVVAVRLHVRLVEHVDAVDVAEVVPVVVLRVVRVANVVDVRLLHKADVLKLSLARHEVSVHRVALAAVDAAELDLLAVEVVAPVAHLGSAEADEAGDVFKSLELRVGVGSWELRVVCRMPRIPDAQHQLVAIGFLGTPQFRRRHR